MIGLEMGQVETVVIENPERLAQCVRDWFIDKCQASIQRRGKCFVALSGGSTPKRLYQLLAELPSDTIDWTKIDLFFGDERNVPHDSLDSNFRMVKEAWIDPLKDRAPRIHPVRTELGSAKEAALDYEGAMRKVAGDEPFLFDIVLLGLGDDAHTASLFPETSALGVTNRWVIENNVPKLNAERITLTAPILNTGRDVAFLVCGANKQWALDVVQNSPKDFNQYPAQLIQPHGKLWWFLDEAAADGPD